MWLYSVKKWQTAALVFCGLLSCLSLSAQQRYLDDVTNIVKRVCQGSLKELSLKMSSSELSKLNGITKDKEAYYIFTSPEKEKGFIIVSGDKRMPAILAYSDMNSFDVNNIPPNVQYWLDSYAESYLQLQNIQILEIPDVTSRIILKEVSPLIDSKWDQGIPFNLYCPMVGWERSVTGCVATAMAQVMNLYKYPNRGKGRISYITSSNKIRVTRDFNHEIKWVDILNDYSGTYSSTQANAVAELMLSCGASVKMDYGLSSGAYQWDLVSAYIENFGYDEDAAFMYRDNCSTRDWHNLLVNELDNGRPVNYGGSGINGGHSFLFDGYRLTEGNTYPEYHVNWGWGGKFDGYYVITDLTPYNNNFNYNQQITLGIMPDDGIIESKRYLCSSIPSLSSNIVKRGNTVSINVADCYNMSYKPFKGSLHAMLTSADNVSTILGETKIQKPIQYMNSIENIKIEVTIPKTLDDGVYTIQLYSTPDGSNDFFPVFSKQYPKLTISNSGEIIPEIDEEVLLGSSELQIVSSSYNSALLQMNIYELQNLEEESFTGDIQMVLADCDGNFLTSFGTSYKCENLNKNEVVHRPIALEGNPKGNFSNGDYRIYVGARTSNSTGMSYVMFYDMIHPFDKYAELYVNARIDNGILIVGEYNFKIEPILPEYIRGDANGDGEVNLDDATFITNIILGIEDATETADVNNDGAVSMPDVMFIINYIKNGKFPDEK